MQGTRVRSLVREDPTFDGTARGPQLTSLCSGAQERQLLKPECLYNNTRFTIRGANEMRSQHSATRQQPLLAPTRESLQWKDQWRARAVTNKLIFFLKKLKGFVPRICTKLCTDFLDFSPPFLKTILEEILLFTMFENFELYFKMINKTVSANRKSYFYIFVK